MINEVCNLRCPYCFADEFVNKNANEISMENFDKALNFALSSDPNERVGIIGGEPTLHSKFKEILIKLINDKRVKNVTIFTNAVCIDKFANELADPKFHLLINCNSPENMGQSKYDTMVSNIDNLINNRYYRDKITLGINMYKPDFDYEYIIDLLSRFKLKKLRTSISVPNDPDFVSNPLHYFELMKPSVLKFFSELEKIGVVPFFDCNAMPHCIWDKEERAEIVKKNPEIVSMTNIFAPTVSCNPIIDILPDLTIIRCFGLSEHTKMNMLDFNNISEARNYYLRTIDAFSCNTCHSSECNSCKERIFGNCNGGCLCFKINDIIDAEKQCNKVLRQ